MGAKISRAVSIVSGIITAICLILTAAAAGSMIARSQITDMLTGAWCLIPLLFLAVNITLYGAYAGCMALLRKGMSGEAAPAGYLFLTATAVTESWVVVLLRYLIASMLTADGPWMELAAAWCSASCSFILLAFILLLPGMVIYGGWEEVCDNTEDAPLYLLAIGLAIAAAGLIVWCAGRLA